MDSSSFLPDEARAGLPRWLTDRRADRLVHSLAARWSLHRPARCSDAAWSSAALARRVRLVLAADVLPGSRRHVAGQLGVDPRTLQSYRASLDEFLAADGFRPPWGRGECRNVDDLIAFLKPPSRRVPNRLSTVPNDPEKLRYLRDLRNCAQSARRRHAQRHIHVRDLRRAGMTLAEAVSWPPDRELTPADRTRLHREYGDDKPSRLRLVEMLASPLPKRYAVGYAWPGCEPLRSVWELIAAIESDLVGPKPLTIRDLAWALGYPESTIRDRINLATLYRYFPPVPLQQTRATRSSVSARPPNAQSNVRR